MDQCEGSSRNHSRVVIEAPPKPPISKNLQGMHLPHPSLPQLPFFVGIIGPRHTGKTVWLYNMLKDADGFYGKTFKKNNIVFFSPTSGDDETLKPLKLMNTFGPPSSPQLIVNQLIDTQRRFKEADNLTGALLVFDDITQCRDAWVPIEDLSYYGRHYHIHVLYVAHKMSSIPRGVRTQTQQWIMFKPHEESEFQWILDMFSRKRTKELWSMALARAWETPYNFVYVDFERKEFDEIYRSGFDDPLFLPYEKEVVLNHDTTDTLQKMTMKNSQRMRGEEEQKESAFSVNKSKKK